MMSAEMSPRKSEVREITNQTEWLGWRRHDYTASRIGVLFECHPFIRSVADVLADMRGQSIKGDTAAMRRGRWLQPAFVEALRDERPEWRVTPATTYHRLPELRLGCTPDFWVDEPAGRGAGLLETKTFSPFEWTRHQGRLPLGYLLQTLCQLIVCDAAWGAVIVMIVSSDLPLFIFDVPRHAAAEARILESVANFWRRVDDDELPESTPSDELAKMFDDGSHVDLSSDNFLPEALERLEVVTTNRREADREKKDLEYQVKNRMGAASTGWLPGWQLSFRTEHRAGYTVEPKEPRILRVRRIEDANGQ